MSRLLIASPHRYPDLARLWHRFVMRELVPAFERLQLAVEVNIFCDANGDQFVPDRFPEVRFSRVGPDMRDFMEFYDGTLNAAFDFLLFIDADTFLLDGNWVCSYFEAFKDPDVAAVSFVPRKGEPAIFALLCRVETYRALAPPIFACRYEFPKHWPHGVNLQPGDFAARELANSGRIIVNIGADESSLHVANFRGTTGVRATREHITRACDEETFLKSLSEFPLYLIAAYDNVLLGCLYEALYHEPFALDSGGRTFGSSLTLTELKHALKQVRNPIQLESLRKRFRRSRRDILRMATMEEVELSLPSVLPNERDTIE